jgi:hypothetical protein
MKGMINIQVATKELVEIDHESLLCVTRKHFAFNLDPSL